MYNLQLDNQRSRIAISVTKTTLLPISVPHPEKFEIIGDNLFYQQLSELSRAQLF
jgi:hypothetical protein